MSQDRAEVFGGVDTHKHTHVAVALDATGTLLGSAAFAADAAGCGDLLGWLRTHGSITRVGVEGTGSYGAGLARRFAAEGIDVAEVNRPNRHTRRRRGKTDTVDAESAARAVLSGEATALPKSGDGCAEAIRVLSLTRRSAVKARTVAANQLRAILLTAPEDLKDRFGTLSAAAAAEACSRLRPDRSCDTVTASVKTALRALARRHQALTDEIAQLDVELRTLCEQANPALLGAVGVGVETASALLVAAGDNPQRTRSEASFAALCGASPVEASSGPQTRHRLNRGGNRNANNALWRIAFTRTRVDQRTIDYAKRRQAEGKTRRETIRCLKRHIAREVYRLLTDPPIVPNRHDLRQQRTRAGLTIKATARALNTWPTRISELENGHRHDRDLAERYQQHLTQLPT
ncbi:IS110 family transposase [Candidatus Poriferisodalis sp.]|uniref:IS110 family transposase n=1 Tax=Candidatus Poriferisodalis sp. TaxID=3101277 RepID=UPI003B028E58